MDLQRSLIVLRCQSCIEGVFRDFEATGDDLLSVLADIADQIHEAGGCSTPAEFVTAWLAANPDAIKRAAAN